jgi:hypothetical protein
MCTICAALADAATISQSINCTAPATIATISPQLRGDQLHCACRHRQNIFINSMVAAIISPSSAWCQKIEFNFERFVKIQVLVN